MHSDYLDFRTIVARQHFYEEEVRLNRRLAESVYMGAVPLTVDQVGHLQWGGCGATIDFLVKMHRLRAEHMLDFTIKDGTARPADIAAIAIRHLDEEKFRHSAEWPQPAIEYLQLSGRHIR